MKLLCDIWRKQADRKAYRYRRVARPRTTSNNKANYVKVALAATSLESRTYDYDANGNVTGINGSSTRSYAYDALDRLVQDAEPGGSQYDLGYDANGNRNTRTTDGTSVLNYAYEANSNVLDAVGAQGVTHDAAGNRTSDRDGNRTFEYNGAGRLFRVYEGGSLVATYTYNALGQRTRKVTVSGTTIYHYDLNGLLISETHSDGRPIRDYVWRDNAPVAQIDVEGAAETVTYLHTDHLATPRLGTDAQGVVVWRWEGEAFGDSPATGSVTVNLRFPGQYYDAETQLHYNWLRYYNPKYGRYVTSDPIGLKGGYNTYGYVGGNPGRWFDFTGLHHRRCSNGDWRCAADLPDPKTDSINAGPVCGDKATSIYVPDKPYFIFDFTPVCEAHDACYSCGRTETQFECDLNFFTDATQKVCIDFALIPGVYASCASTAAIYSGVLMAVGEEAFLRGRADCPNGDCDK